MITLTCEATTAQRREALEDLAKRWDVMPASARTRMLEAVTVLRGEALRAAMGALRAAIREAGKAESDPDWDDGPVGMVCDPRTQRWLLACQRVNTAMTVLLREPVVTS
jgi:hypothetical protein